MEEERASNKEEDQIEEEILTSINKRENLKKNFQTTWPLRKVMEMTLEEYNNLNKDNSFCYWVETVTYDLGNIKGVPSFKFGIFKRNNTETEYTASTYTTDGEYAWLSKYGDNRDEAFQSVKQLIISVIKYVQEDDLEAIDNIDLSNMYKWKIAFLYSDFRVINIFSQEMLKNIAKMKGLEEADNQRISSLHLFLIKHKPSNTSFFDYTDDLLKLYKQRRQVKREKWIWLIILLLALIRYYSALPVQAKLTIR